MVTPIAWLRQRRKALDLTQDELGQRVGCTGDTIRKIEADARRPSKAIAERLATCLAMGMDERAVFLRLCMRRGLRAAYRKGRCVTGSSIGV